MPTFDVHTGMLIGLPLLVISWVLIQLLGRVFLSYGKGRAEKMIADPEERVGAIDGLNQTIEFWHSLFIPGLAVVVLGWAAMFMFTGWTTSGQDNPVQEMEQEGPGELYTGENNPRTADDRVREEGRAIQEEQFENLDEFRNEFFDKRKKEDE